ncbi:lipopolysaccharide biosynthesis protein, partial [Vibrio aestuarianus]
MFTLSVIIITNIDNILIIKYFDSSMVSSYSINLKLMNVLFGSVMVVNLAIAPLLGNYLGHDNIQRIKSMYNDSFYICIVLCSFLFIWLLYVGNDVIALWTSTEVLVSKGIFISMLSFACMYTIVNLHVTISSAMNFTKTLPFIGLFEVLLNIVLSIFLLSYFGVLGVILGSLIASILIPSIIHPILIKKLSDEQIYIEKRLVIQCLAVIAPMLLVSIYSYVFEVYAFSKFTQLALANMYLILGF